MGAALLFIEISLGYLVFWTLGHFLKRFIGKTVMDNISGPPSESFLTGEPSLPYTLGSRLHSACFAANLKRLHAPDAWEYHQRLADTCESPCDA